MPRPIVSGRPIPSSRMHNPMSPRRSRSLTREASEKSTSTRVISASALTSSRDGVKPSGVTGPWVSSKPASTNTTGAVTSNRSSRADSVPHANTTAATIAMSDALIVS